MAPTDAYAPRRRWTTSPGSSASRTPASCSTGRWSAASRRRCSPSSTTRSTSWSRARGFDEEEADPFAPRDEADRLAASISVSGSQINLAEIAADQDDDRDRDVVRLADPNPLRFIAGRAARTLEGGPHGAAAGPARPGAKPPTHRHVPVGPYRLTVIPSIRGRAAGQIAIQGMVQKQIELTTPTVVRTKGTAGKPLVAIWVYRDNSLVIAHLDFMGSDASSSGTPPGATSSITTTPPTSTTSCSRSAWRPPTSSTRS